MYLYKKYIRKKFILVCVLSFISYVVSAQEIKTYKNLDASKQTTYFNFEKDKVVTGQEAWDLSFNRTTLEVNSGKVQGQIVKSSFEALKKAPESGYFTDAKAIPTGSGKGWYKYSMLDHSITPLPERVIVLKTTSGKYVKVEILSYNKNQSESGETAFYTFRYAEIP